MLLIFTLLNISNRLGVLYDRVGRPVDIKKKVNSQPKTASKTGTSVSYLYDAQGTKLRKSATVGSTVTQQDYVGGIEYATASAIERIATEEGYLLNSSGTYSYHYSLADQLGNVRAVVKRDATATTADVVQRQDYS